MSANYSRTVRAVVGDGDNYTEVVRIANPDELADALGGTGGGGEGVAKASQDEVNSGAAVSKYVAPDRLAGRTATTARTGLVQLAGTTDASSTDKAVVPAALAGYVKTTDPALTNSRTPTAHVSTHKTGGTDPLSPSDIGAVANGDSRLTDARTPTTHAATHAPGGSDPVTGYVQTDDARLSDDRTPTAHVLTHKTGGGDALSPADIGAAASDDSRLTDARTPTVHAATHEAGGSDPVSLNYQAQSAAADAGKVLVAGVAAGTYGVNLGIDAAPTPNSDNLVLSKAIYAALSDKPELLSGKNIYFETTGNDNNPGTQEAPVRSMQGFVNIMNASKGTWNTCRLRFGEGEFDMAAKPGFNTVVDTVCINNLDVGGASDSSNRYKTILYNSTSSVTMDLGTGSFFSQFGFSNIAIRNHYEGGIGLRVQVPGARGWLTNIAFEGDAANTMATCYDSNTTGPSTIGGVMEVKGNTGMLMRLFYTPMISVNCTFDVHDVNNFLSSFSVRFGSRMLISSPYPAYANVAGQGGVRALEGSSIISSNAATQNIAGYSPTGTIIIDSGYGSLLNNKYDPGMSIVGMPSERFVGFAYPGDGGTYTAPANGYVSIIATGTEMTSAMYMANLTAGNFIVQAHSIVDPDEPVNRMFCNIPCRKGDVVKFRQAGAGFTVERSAFFYAEANK